MVGGGINGILDSIISHVDCILISQFRLRILYCCNFSALTFKKFQDLKK